MKMLRKITDDKSLEISQENAYEGISFRKVTNLQCSDCNFVIKIVIIKIVIENVVIKIVIINFLEYVPKTSCLKKQYFEKKSMADQLLNKVATLQYTALSFMKKTELM